MEIEQYVLESGYTHPHDSKMADPHVVELIQIWESMQQRNKKHPDVAVGWPCPQISVDELMQRTQHTDTPRTENDTGAHQTQHPDDREKCSACGNCGKPVRYIGECKCYDERLHSDLRTQPSETEQEKNERLSAEIDAMPLNVHSSPLPVYCEHNISPKEACHKCYVTSTKNIDNIGSVQKIKGTFTLDEELPADEQSKYWINHILDVNDKGEALICNGIAYVWGGHGFLKSDIGNNFYVNESGDIIKSSKPSETNEQQLKRELPAFKLAAKDFMKDASPEQIQNYLDKIVPTQNPSTIPCAGGYGVSLDEYSDHLSGRSTKTRDTE